MTAGNTFSQQLAQASTILLANRANPAKAVEPFDPLLVALRSETNLADERLSLVRDLGSRLFEALKSSSTHMAMEVRHFCLHLAHLGDAETSSGINDMLMVTLTRFAHYSDHSTDRCSLCAEYPHDLPKATRAGRKTSMSGLR
jgi:hypothetical protein